MKLKVPFYKQDTIYSCGATAVQMLLKFFGISYSEDELIDKLKVDKEFGASPSEIEKLITKEGLFCYVNTDSKLEEIEFFLSRKLPVLVNFIEPTDNEGHYAVIVGDKEGNFILNDPWNGKNFKITKKEFGKRWKDE